ncbi:MAG: hypothetical protein INR71_03865, partial [Terriglobus roseus]|nr:hypothetical protein [Terriglobus roseus]
MNGSAGQTLQNVLSISTAANNRYLLHFNSLNSLTQWTAGIRLAMFEHSSLQEAYTGSIIAGKGRGLNNIRAIMDRTKFRHEDWARVRFGAGTPWRRCWCVIEPPDEKEYQKAQKAVKKNPYEKAPRVKGDIKFYDSNKVKKKTRPIATITDAYSAYAIYPQSKPLIDQSTLVKLEGRITIHTSPETETEGFVFIMPEVHPAVSGFEMMLRFLFPVWDIFNLYGRPNRLIADPIDSKGLMFALPTDRRYGYLEILDVSGLIHTKGSGEWSEYRWRKEMKNLTSTHMDTPPDERPGTQSSTRRKKLSRSSLPGSRNGVRFGDETPVESEPTSARGSPGPRGSFDRPARAETAPTGWGHHRRSLSERLSGSRHSRVESTDTQYQTMSAESLRLPPAPPPHRELMGQALGGTSQAREGGSGSPDSFEATSGDPVPEVAALAASSPPPAPVAAPPAFAHGPSQRPAVRPNNLPQFQNQGPMDEATLSQLADANRNAPLNYASAGAAAAWTAQPNGRHSRNGSAEDVRSQDMLAPADSQGRQSSASPRYRTQRSQLPTIPASPFIDQVEPSPKRSYFEPAGPAVPEHSAGTTPAALTPGSGSSAMARPDLGRTGSVFGISRKPVGGQVGGARTPQEEYAAAEKGLYDQTGNVPGGRPSFDNRSMTPDYASVKSADTQKSVDRHSIEKPRIGVLRTVGSAVTEPKEVVIGETHYGVQETADKPAVPAAAESSEFNVDFGPTYALTTGSRPGASGGTNRHPDASPGRLSPNANSPSAEALGSSSGGAQASYFAGVKTSPPRDADVDAEPGTVAWRPGLVPSPAKQQQPKQAMSAHEWVQQRAALAAQPRPVPKHAHARNKSSIELLNRSAASTPPFPAHTPPSPSPAVTPDETRQSSGDWAHPGRLQHQRSSSRELLQGRNSRPSSRQLNMTPHVDVNKLTAKEREYVARSTGTPLMTMSGGERPAP